MENEIIVGLKLTHDAGVAIIENGRLSSMTEIEKLDNNERYSAGRSWDTVLGVLRDEGVPIHSHRVQYVVDGWKYGHIPAFQLRVAPYHHHDPGSLGIVEPMMAHSREWPTLGTPISYEHVTGHILGSYMTAPFAGQEAYVVVWDGGIVPRVYHVADKIVNFIGCAGKYTALLYGIMGYYAGPYRVPEIAEGRVFPEPQLKFFGRRDVPGKLMSWIAHGEVRHDIVMYARKLAREAAQPELPYNQTGLPEHALMRRLYAKFRDQYGDADLLASVHTFIENDLLREITACVPIGSRLVFTGGAALNIKWNSALRESGHFSEVWVPPFPNDSGSALGAAAAHLFFSGTDRLEWNVYSGPKVGAATEKGWSERECSFEGLANILHDTGEPVVVLHGRAEIGPRALGHRSIMMAPHADAQRRLNEVKGREDWRPVAPIILEEDAPQYFYPGTRDPYMLFDHFVKYSAKLVMPAVVHLDNTARIQTVGADGCAMVRELLFHVRRLSGFGVLCNTSANRPGCGFFPDVASAQRWGKVPRIWSEGTLYTRR